MSDSTSTSRRRTVASLLAGGGLGAAVLGALGSPFSAEALAVEAPTVTKPSGTATGTVTTPAEAPTGSTGTTSTSTTPLPPATTTQAATAPTVTQTATTQTGTAPSPAPAATGEGDQSPARRVRVRTRTHAPRATVQHSQQSSATATVQTKATSTPSAASTAAGAKSSAAIAPAPQLAAIQSSALAALTGGSAASLQALDFYRIPPFLLPIYQAAAVQYGVPWQVLAAINEVETDFGADQSVSSAGAVGWMQFMPETWLQYGVDALNAGYADPYNPVDAIFAAARYLHAAGASSNLRDAIFSYNHSEAYVESVLLRARLFASYPSSAIATLTGLTEGRQPVAGARVAPGSPIPAAEASTSATQAPAPPPASARAAAAGGGSVQTPSAPATSPAVRSASRRARKVQGESNAPAPAKQLSTLVAKRGAPVVAVEDGRIVALGHSRKLGGYLVLRDTYGDVFTYAGLGSIAPDFRVAKPEQLNVAKGALPSDEAGREPAPRQPASAGSQSPLTLHVAAPRPSSQASAPAGEGGEQSAGVGGKVRVFAHPGNPDARLARHLRERATRDRALPAGWAVLARGSLVAQGTVLGHLAAGDSSQATLRFAIRPAGAQSAIDPRPILENWRQLALALHPHGARAGSVLAGATAAEAFSLSAFELERAVLADPGIQMGACDRSQVALGKVDRRALALLVFLSRSGLKPTVGELRCGAEVRTHAGAAIVFPSPGTLDIAAINGVPIAGHQGAGTVTDETIRTLLTIGRRYAPKRIVSLMSYPGARTTLAASDHTAFIGLELGATPRRPRGHAAAAAPAGTAVGASAAAARAASATSTAPSPALSLDTLQWQHLIGQIGTIQQPKLLAAPSGSAIRDARP